MRTTIATLVILFVVFGCAGETDGDAARTESDDARGGAVETDGATTERDAETETGADAMNAPAERTLELFVVDGAPRSLVEGSSITLALLDHNAVSGNAGVNRFNARPEVNEQGHLVWPPIVTTKMAGPPALMAQEDAFLEALRRTDRMLIEKDLLVLENGDGTIRLIFR